MSSTILSLVILIISVSLHEAAHGFAALWLGDPTAKIAGRLTVNPLKHLDLFGSVILPALLVLSGSPILVGWAKPVPYNPYNLRNRRWGEALVAAAGPAANVALAAVFAVTFRLAGASLSAPLATFLATVVVVNLSLAAFNLLPVPPLDGSKILAAFLGSRGRAYLSMPFTSSLVLLLIVAFYLWPVVGGWVLKLSLLALGA